MHIYIYKEVHVKLWTYIRIKDYKQNQYQLPCCDTVL